VKRILLVVAAVALASLGAEIASAGTPRIDRREVRQHVRIHQGVRSGQLTRVEAARLRAGQRHVHRMERRAKADGCVTFRERARITRAQNHESRVIYRLKHNPRVRG
jgi:hypothetical protein